MIRLQSVSKFVRQGANRIYILRNVNLDIREGEFVTIMGPSGAGKSTLLNVLGLLESADEGTYEFEGQQAHTFSEKQRSTFHKETIGFVFQAYHLIDELTVYENLETPLLYQKIGKGERKSMVADMLDRFQIVGKKDLFPHQLSGGQQQLVGVARAIISKPRLLLADEPTGNLHTRQGEEIMELFTRLNQEEKITIVQVTHSEKNAAYGSRIIHLADGWVEREESIS